MKRFPDRDPDESKRQGIYAPAAKLHGVGAFCFNVRGYGVPYLLFRYPNKCDPNDEQIAAGSVPIGGIKGWDFNGNRDVLLRSCNPFGTQPGSMANGSKNFMAVLAAAIWRCYKNGLRTDHRRVNGCPSAWIPKRKPIRCNRLLNTRRHHDPTTSRARPDGRRASVPGCANIGADRGRSSSWRPASYEKDSSCPFTDSVGCGGRYPNQGQQNTIIWRPMPTICSTGLNKGHDFSADSVADGKHFAYSGKSMRLQLQIAQEYSMAGYVSRRPPARVAGARGHRHPDAYRGLSPRPAGRTRSVRRACGSAKALPG